MYMTNTPLFRLASEEALNTMHMRFIKLILAGLMMFALLSLMPPQAQAMHRTAEYLEVADKYWGNHQCAGQMRVAEDPTLPDRGVGGEAQGLLATWDGSTWQYSVESCWFSVDPAYHGLRLCVTIIHEVGHFVDPGALHTGPMAPETLGPASLEYCLAHERSLRPRIEAPDVATFRPQEEPKPITKRQLVYRELKHKHYHHKSNFAPAKRQRLAVKWHDLVVDARDALESQAAKR
jgi:hypothetical protein